MNIYILIFFGHAQKCSSFKYMAKLLKKLNAEEHGKYKVIYELKIILTFQGI